MKELKQAFLDRYPKYEIILRQFEEANQCAATWANLSKLRLQNFVDHLSLHLAPNSVRQYCAKLKAVLNLYNEEVELPRDYAKILSVKDEKSTSVFLRNSEIQKLENYPAKSQNEQIVKNQFLLGVFTGARHSDFMNFDERNIVENHLVYVSQKTKIQAIVPLKPIVRKLLETTPKVKLSEATFNTNLRRICKKAGIDEEVKVYKGGRMLTGKKWEFVSSHTARRTFATNLYLLGLDIYTISRFLGHKSVEITAQNYICCAIRELPEDVKTYFS